jgi:hypothetical protein
MHRLAAPALFLVCVLFYWKLTLTSEFVWFNHPDMCNIELPKLQFQAREFHNGRFPLWDPYLWMGQPLIGQMQPGPLFPFNLLLALLPLNDGYLDWRWLNWYFVVTRFLAAAFLYALCRDLRRSRVASFAAGCAFAFGGLIGNMAWLDVVNGAIWTPAICLFFLRAARGVRPLRNAALCGAFLGLAWLSGHHEIPALVSYALAAGWAYTVWRRGLRAIPLAALTFALAGLVAAAQLWPAFEFAHLSRRWAGVAEPLAWNEPIPYTVPAHYSWPARGLLGTFVHDPVLHADSTAFAGVVVTAMAVFALCARWRVPAVRWMAALGAVAIVYALGAATPLHGLLFSVAPVLGKARIPVRAIHLLNFALAVLAARGIDAVLARTGAGWLRRFAIATGALGAALLAISLVRKDASDAFVIAGVVAIVLAASLAAWRNGTIGRAGLSAALLLAMIGELYPAATRRLASRFEENPSQPLKSLTANRDIVEFLEREPAPRRLIVNDRDIPINFGDWHGFDSMEGFTAAATANLLAFERHRTEVQNLFGVTHYVAREPDRPGQQDSFTGASGVKVFRNPGAFPRAWAVHDAVRVASAREANDLVTKPGFDARRTAPVAGEIPPLERCAANPVELVARAPNRVRLRAAMNCRGLVVLSETFYPGWAARIDGRDAPVVAAFGAFRGVVVERGSHEIEYRYAPRSVYGGAVLTALGLLLVTVLAALG